MAKSHFLRLRSRLRHGYFRFRSYVGRPRTVVQEKPVVVADIDCCENPIFLIGVHRSGTSLVRRILNSHSNIACPPETYYLKHFAEMVRDDDTFAGFDGLGYNYESTITEIRKWASRYHEAYRIMSNKPRWADKTPQYVHILPELETLFGPGARYIMIFRHPLDVIHSIWSRGWRFGDYDSDLLRNTAMYVAEAQRVQLSFMASHPGRTASLHYENLVENPEQELRKILTFLSEDWEDQILEYHQFSHNFGTEDPIVRGTQGFKKNSGNWRIFRQVELATVLPTVSGVMDQLGYTTD